MKGYLTSKFEKKKKTHENKTKNDFKVIIPEDRIFYRVISDISFALRETILTILDSIEITPPVESEK